MYHAPYAVYIVQVHCTYTSNGIDAIADATQRISLYSQPTNRVPRTAVVSWVIWQKHNFHALQKCLLIFD